MLISLVINSAGGKNALVMHSTILQVEKGKYVLTLFGAAAEDGV